MHSGFTAIFNGDQTVFIMGDILVIGAIGGRLSVVAVVTIAKYNTGVFNILVLCRQLQFIIMKWRLVSAGGMEVTQGIRELDKYLNCIEYVYNRDFRIQSMSALAQPIWQRAYDDIISVLY